MNPARLQYRIALPVVLLSALGIIVVYSSSFYIARGNTLFGHYYYLIQHLFRLLLGVLAFLFMVFVPLRFLNRHALKLLIFSLVLVLGLMAFGHVAHGARRSFRVASFLFFQPSDLARLSLVLFLAAFLARRKEIIGSFRRTYLPALGILVLVTAAIAVQPDLSTSLIVLGIGIAMLFFAGARLSHLLLTVVLGALVFLAAHKAFPHVQERVQSYSASEEHYQLTQAKIGLATGGLFGAGPGRGKEKLRYLPLPHTDFVFATVGEEFGYLGSLAVIVLFLFLGLSGFKLAQLHIGDPYKSYLAFGFSFMILMYVLVHVSVTLGIFPTTGQPLPFISYGGSAMLCNMAAAGVLYRLALDAHSDLERKKAWRRSLS
jgi:cell division protein FtsW